MDHRNLGGRKPFQEVAITIFVHEKTNRAAMHAVDRLAGIHEPLQGRQHEAIAAERDYDVRGLGPDVAVALDQAPPRPLRCGHIAGHEGDALIAGCRAFFRHAERFQIAAATAAGDRLWTRTMNASCSCIRLIRLLSRRSGSAGNWSNAGSALALIFCPAWSRCTGG